MRNELNIPEAVDDSESSVEMLRVWIAKGGLHCSIKVGMYAESTRIPEELAWGTILADVARHVSHALQDAYSDSSERALRAIVRSFLEEIDAPTSDTSGQFKE